MEAVYNKGLATYVARGFLTRHGTILGDIDTLIAECNFAFVKYADRWIPEKAKFSTFMHSRMVWHLLTELRNTKKRKEKLMVDLEGVGTDSLRAESFPAKPAFLKMDFLDSLSKDAAEVVQLVFDTPRDLNDAMIQRGRGDHNTRAAVKIHLKKSGWTVSRINRIFTEIKEAL